MDDFVVRRNDGTPAYQLAVVVDDAAQGIGEVVRGADLVDSTPRQILLAGLLGLPEPGYAHVPLVLGPDGRRLAKRHGAVTLSDRAALGEGPEEARAWMARSLGLAGAGETPSPDDLIARFDSETIAARADRLVATDRSLSRTLWYLSLAVPRRCQPSANKKLTG